MPNDPEGLRKLLIEDMNKVTLAMQRDIAAELFKPWPEWLTAGRKPYVPPPWYVRWYRRARAYLAHVWWALRGKSCDCDCDGY